MKSKLLLIVLISLSLFLTGCSFDESFERNQQHDGDDIDVIRDIGPQALDQVLYSEETDSIAQGLNQTSQTAPVATIPVVSQQPTETQSSSVPTYSDNEYESEDD